ncbi:MAG: B12-binding domain-containing radical SAM protein [Thermodesulfobacteriota bacterium]
MQCSRKPHILLVNPWIHDFAAYDFWAKPLGLLQLAGILQNHGMAISYIDCLDRFHPSSSPTNPMARYGRGPYLKTPIPNPPGLEDVQRTYSRYGIKKEWFRESMDKVGKPDLILVTTLMTYWYPGVQETIHELKNSLPDAPVVLGGVYASLCRDHARQHSGADQVVSGPGEEGLLDLVQAFTGFKAAPRFDPENLNSFPYPAFQLQSLLNYVPLMMSRGCPFACAYCASGFLNPNQMQRSPASVVAEVEFWRQKEGVVDFAFYDDALLVNSGKQIIPILQQIIHKGLNIRFHTPNALHVREINQEVADLMFRAGFKTIRLGLETAAFDHRDTLDSKVTADEFSRAVDHLKAAGFSKEQVGAYLLWGLPGQAVEEVEASIQIVKNCGITPVIAHYTPIPHTDLWPQAVAASRYDLAADPVFTNNAVMPCQKEPFSWSVISRLKHLVAEEN